MRFLVVLLTASAFAQGPSSLGRTQPDQAAVERYEFERLANEFVKRWNNLTGLYVRGQWDVREADEVAKAFEKLTKSPYYLTKEKLKPAKKGEVK